MLWEVSMEQPVFIMHVVCPTNAQGGDFDQLGLARKIENIVKT
jgi:hypothetical protein